MHLSRHYRDLHVSSLVDTRWHAVGQLVQEELLGSGRWCLELVHESGGLNCIERKWRDPLGCALGGVRIDLSGQAGGESDWCCGAEEPNLPIWVSSGCIRYDGVRE